MGDFCGEGNAVHEPSIHCYSNITHRHELLLDQHHKHLCRFVNVLRDSTVIRRSGADVKMVRADRTQMTDVRTL